MLRGGSKGFHVVGRDFSWPCLGPSYFLPLYYYGTRAVRTLADILFISFEEEKEDWRSEGAAAARHAATLSKNAIKGSLRRNSGAKGKGGKEGAQPEPETENNLREFLPQFPLYRGALSLASRHSPVLQSVSGEDSLGFVHPT